MVLVKVRVLGGDYRVLEIRGDLAERNKFVALAIRRLLNPGLQASFDVHRGGRRVDPPGRHQNQRGKRPKKQQDDDEPSNKGSGEARPKRRLGASVRHFGSDFRIIVRGRVAAGG